MLCSGVVIYMWRNYSLRGEWLYSQGRGRHFRVGDQEDLSQYLASVCPLSGEQLETEEDRKLRLILSKAQHHQQQLREQCNTNYIFPGNFQLIEIFCSGKPYAIANFKKENAQLAIFATNLK